MVSRPIASAAGVVALVHALAATAAAGEFSVSSSSFADGGKIATVYSCKGRDTAVQLAWREPPPGTKSFAIIMDDPDAQSVAGYTWVHWNVLNVPATVLEVAEGGRIQAALIGRNDFGKRRYDGPCPPRGSHRYVIAIYALDGEVEEGFSDSPRTRAEFEEAIASRILAKAEIAGTFP